MYVSGFGISSSYLGIKQHLFLNLVFVCFLNRLHFRWFLNCLRTTILRKENIISKYDSFFKTYFCFVKIFDQRVSYLAKKPHFHAKFPSIHCYYHQVKLFRNTLYPQITTFSRLVFAFPGYMKSFYG